MEQGDGVLFQEHQLFTGKFIISGLEWVEGVNCGLK